MPATNFKPDKHGFRFTNSFQNDFIRELDVRTGGLCGGMVYAALDYFYSDMDVPKQEHLPAVHTRLHDYIYDRLVNSIMDNLDKWIELGLNPFGVRDAEFFNWGLQGFNGGRLEELRSLIDVGTPAPLGLQTYKGAPWENHQVLAIGYELGRYRGDLGNHKGDLKIFVYDPNNPRKTMTLVPDVRNQVYYLREDPEPKWRTYFVDKKYRPKIPPAIPTDEPAAAEGQVGELILSIYTGDDDLRGGDDNLDVTVYVRGKPPQRFPNVNRGRRWIDHYNQAFSIWLNNPVPVEDITRVKLHATFSGGLGGDNWNMNGLTISARGRGVIEPIYRRAGNPLYRFTGEQKDFIARIS